MCYYLYIVAFFEVARKKLLNYDVQCYKNVFMMFNAIKMHYNHYK